ncbi:cap-specific mRNA (nucleoside-2'-O-)-methyltransferase 2 [Lampris incognitus]|uniref:cap-specific mRNA (nucleoside-2'-O-)-methyltransferase 2 n=1 Tax=Lampris incognitus TaxID=2546036 RepID=UPI0024B5A32E|nr:cap-specific mRNA (nucleoside-2'-O-)-methyltransferase 2 [Lampris incognitus]
MSQGQGTKRKAGRLQQPSAAVAALDAEMETEVRELFNKVRTYAKPSSGEWCIPHPVDALRHPPQEYSRLQALKVSLNAVKNQLSDKDLAVWHHHTNSTNRAGKITATVRSAANAEICTQAWCKFYEILGSFSLLPEEALQSGELNTIHLCEAPGAFITALNHYIKTSEHTRFCDWSWAANTLNPYHEGNGGNMTIADDRLIANTLPWWFFGSDNTGDIMSQEHLLELQTFVGNMRRVGLVTADGSFDCQEKPDEQEALVASLHLCETTAALLLLSPGSSFVLKMFTLYEHSSVCLLYLLNCCFRSVSVFKPATSKAGNSEVYIICLQYENKEAVRPLLSKLIRNYGPNMAKRTALFKNSQIPPSFLEQHEQVSSYFHKLQVETIQENLRMFEAMSAAQRQRLDHIREFTAQEYLRRLQVSWISRSRWLSRNTVNPACCSVSAGRPLGQRKQLGSFNERREMQTLNWRERIEKSHHGLWIQQHCDEASGTGCVLAGPLTDCHVDSWYVVVGAALTVVRNSPFCEGGLLSHLNEALVQSTDKSEFVWAGVPPCRFCCTRGAASILLDVAKLSNCTVGDREDGSKEKRKCLVFDRGAAWGACEDQTEDLLLEFCVAPSLSRVSGSTLHDGERTYQRELLDCVLFSLQNLNPGDALLLPLLSALTRVTAALVFCLHMSFHTVTFRSPPHTDSSGVMLVCAGFCPEAVARILPVLTDLHGHMAQLAKGEENTCGSGSPVCQRQILQFVPMEELLKGGLTDFLCAMNSTIIQQKLHLLMQAEHMCASGT